MGPSCTLDHIAIVAPDLAAGVQWAAACLGVTPPAGGAHREMGTHNHLLRLGEDQFLEVIAIDPSASAPARPRWFNLDDRATIEADWREGRRLRSMVARSGDLAACAAADPEAVGAVETMSRGDRTWRFGVSPDGRLADDGATPALMDWGARGPAGPAMPDHGCRLVGLVVETPKPDQVASRLGRLGLERAPTLRSGARVKLIAAIDTPDGLRILT